MDNEICKWKLNFLFDQKFLELFFFKKKMEIIYLKKDFEDIHNTYSQLYEFITENLR